MIFFRRKEGANKIGLRRFAPTAAGWATESAAHKLFLLDRLCALSSWTIGSCQISCVSSDQQWWGTTTAFMEIVFSKPG
ncbi:Hypothetical predicted protein [Cloeon dipterum]|uniref:Uncharacterized protein n=1 Tax=Cloeon dipterum TaxID=197152 RepID=A0A8S1CCT5_9INSE|nr:Hypothetical predicted protein [Cloeon dipterum]